MEKTMEKIIVFGLGDDFKRNKKNIESLFEVVGCTDNYKKPFGEWENMFYIHPDQLLERSFDKILICTTKYKDAIKINLLKKGIKNWQILSLDDIKKINAEDDFLEVINDIEKYNEKNKNNSFLIREDALMLITNEKRMEAGIPQPHYFAQDIWAARKIYANRPVNHYDIGSSLNGFIAHLLIFREVNYIDIRPLKKEIPGLHFLQGDVLNLEKVFSKENTVESLSSLNVMEHFGLGRYGDPIDPDAYKKAAKSMQNVLCAYGHLYLSVPVGPEDKLVFNAHRIFKIKTILELFDQCNLNDIAIVEPNGAWFHPLEEVNFSSVNDFSCGLFDFVKKERR